ncbi:MAG TPA: CRISPR-associated endonuclease Cas1 [Acidimicrobiales bacterium]|nr:CRISPR-associated endonuclease Cas1 [Acidimicrobiales bacterium]
MAKSDVTRVIRTGTKVVREGPPLTVADIDDVLYGLEAGFSADPAGPSVAVVLGHGARVDVFSGHLRARDGEGWYRRERSWNRATARLSRLIIGAGSGAITLGAIRWCAEADVSVLIVDDDAKVLLAPAAGACDPRLLRLQASPPDGLDVEAATILLRAKLRGQAGVTKTILGRPDLAETIIGLAEGLDAANDVAEARQLEASAAACYFDAWCEHPATTLRFTTGDARRVPTHWPVFDGRRSLLTKGTSNRKAERPLNAVLNLMYSLAAIEARLACETVGLHPALGFVHADEPRRDNLALDLLEPVRPEVERFVLDLVAERTFARRDFVERSDGSIRIAPDLVQLLAATMPMWARAVAPYAEQLAHLLGRAVAGKWQARTPLTGRNHRAAQARVRARQQVAGTMSRQSVDPRRQAQRVASKTAATVLATCVDCGGPLTRSRHLRCPSCWESTPTQSREVRRRRGRAIAAARSAQEAWRAEHPGTVIDRADFLATITPRLKEVPLRQIMQAAGVTKATASGYRNGKSVPHPSYWPALAGLVGVDEDLVLGGA